MENKLAIVIPAYNEEGNILQLITSINLFVPNNMIIAVDDSLNSKTSQVLAEYTRDNLKLISRKQKLGRGSAVFVEMEQHMQYKFDYLLEMDADFSHNPSEIPNLISTIKIENSDLVIASRYLKGSKISNWPIRKRIFSKIANRLCAIVLSSNVNDHTNGFRIYSRRAIELILNECEKIADGFIFLSEIIAQLKLAEYKIIEKETDFKNRIRGESSLSWTEIHSALIGLMLIKKSIKKSIKK